MKNKYDNLFDYFNRVDPVHITYSLFETREESFLSYLNKLKLICDNIEPRSFYPSRPQNVPIGIF